MKITKVFVRSLLMVLVFVTAGGAATTGNIATFSAVLTYPRNSGSSNTSRAFHGTRGEAYRFRLDPGRDVNGKIIAFELLMECASPPERGSNLLDPTGRVHGLQKWDFVANEFAPGNTRPPGYGKTRTIDLPNLGLNVQIEVVRYGVKPTRAARDMPSGYQFTNFAVKVLARAAPVGARATRRSRCHG